MSDEMKPTLTELQTIEKQLTQFLTVCNKTGFPTDISVMIKKVEAYIDVSERLRFEVGAKYPDFKRIDELIKKAKELGAP